jgi:hypothetical protein
MNTKEKIDASKYVNTETGETLESEQGQITSVNKPNPNYVKMKSDSFYIIDDEAIKYLSTILSKSDMLHLHNICVMVNGNYNILHDAQQREHTRATLMQDLDLARNAFGRLMIQLEKQGVIYYIVGYNKGARIKYIMLNPNIARRTNVIHKDCIKHFQSFKGMI